jgi:pyruvate formate lyase activating enzyme
MTYELNAPLRDADAAFVVPTKHWHRVADGRVQCDICPRQCRLHEGQRGMCFVRACESGAIVLTTYGRSSGFCIDPIEKKPLNHFLPGTPVLSFGTAGCNLACKFCQNWDISKSRDVDTLADAASPERIGQVADELECRSVAFTYNDPVIFHEYAIDVADACHARGIRCVAVTADIRIRRRAPSSTRTWMRPTSTSRALRTRSIAMSAPRISNRFSRRWST